jgi:hypothetical protein
MTPYSGYGPYGRHNHEYTQAELPSLLERCGFVPEIAYTADVHTNRATEFCGLRRLAELLAGRSPASGSITSSRLATAGERPSGGPRGSTTATLPTSPKQGGLRSRQPTGARTC